MATGRPPATWEEYARDLGIELQRHRIAAGISQEELAHRAGLTRTHYQQIERGSWTKGRPANPSLHALARLAHQLGVEVGDLTPTVRRLTAE
jgi:transcriptional regulator with XRE-family HTH domain